GKNIYITNACISPDYGGIYEQACYLKANDSFILISGCCHPGLNNFLKDREFLGISDKTSLNLIGVFRSFKFSNKEANLLNPQINSLILWHCTKNIKAFKTQFREKYAIGIIGKSMIFPY
ncbi:MAG: hypothetical protein ACFFG0_53620, partial [Candidatus Thorarchaeota archaeon]